MTGAYSCATANGMPTTIIGRSPTTVDGATGFAARGESQGATWLQYTLVRGPLAMTVSTDLGKNATDIVAEQWTKTIAESLRVDVSELAGTWPGSVADPGVPFTYTLPRALAVPEQYRTWIAIYSVDLLWRDVASRFAFYQRDSIKEATGEYAELLAESEAKYIPTERIKIARATRDGIGKIVDEGYLLRVGPYDRPEALGVIFRRDRILVKVLTSVAQGANVYDARMTAALNAPMGIIRLWEWERI